MDKKIPVIPRQVAEIRVKKYSPKIRDLLILYSIYRNDAGFDVNETIDKLSNCFVDISKIKPNVKFSKEDYKTMLFSFGTDLLSCRRTLADFKEVNVTMNHLYPDFIINRYNVPDLYKFTSAIMDVCIPMLTISYGVSYSRFKNAIKNILGSTGNKKQ